MAFGAPITFKPTIIARHWCLVQEWKGGKFQTVEAVDLKNDGWTREKEWLAGRPVSTMAMFIEITTHGGWAWKHQRPYSKSTTLK
jgi:hypothetical protein